MPPPSSHQSHRESRRDSRRDSRRSRSRPRRSRSRARRSRSRSRPRRGTSQRRLHKMPQPTVVKKAKQFEARESSQSLPTLFGDLLIGMCTCQINPWDQVLDESGDTESSSYDAEDGLIREHP